MPLTPSEWARRCLWCIVLLESVEGLSCQGLCQVPLVSCSHQWQTLTCWVWDTCGPRTKVQGQMGKAASSSAPPSTRHQPPSTPYASLEPRVASAEQERPSWLQGCGFPDPEPELIFVWEGGKWWFRDPEAQSSELLCKGFLGFPTATFISGRRTTMPRNSLNLAGTHKSGFQHSEL